MMLSRDISHHINTGFWIVKNTEYSMDILKCVHQFPELRDRIYEDQDVFNQLYKRNILELQNHSTILSTEQQHIMNCCVGLYKWGYFLIHFMSLSRHGLRKSLQTFYPKKRDDENDNQYEWRLNFMKNYNK